MPTRTPNAIITKRFAERVAIFEPSTAVQLPCLNPNYNCGNADDFNNPADQVAAFRAA
jgi:hypothetical protein